MAMICAVSFSRHGRLYYFDPGEHAPAVGDKVLIPTDDGPEVAECMWAPTWIDSEVGGTPTLVGIAGPADLARDETRRRLKAEIRVAAKRLVRDHDLPMKIVGVDATLDSGDNLMLATAYFTAPRRVDFRGLVRDLGATMRTRVELRQLGSRDEARAQGGIGSCGRDLCCATFLRDFEPVSLKMARDQDLPVNPMRISGACGRLMCCLKYEHPLYTDFLADAPPIGAEVLTPDGAGRVTGHSVPTDVVVVRLDEGGRRTTCSRAGVCGSRIAHDAGPTTGTAAPPAAVG